MRDGSRHHSSAYVAAWSRTPARVRTKPRGETKLDAIKFEMEDGSQVVVEESDVPLKGLEALIHAVDVYQEQQAQGRGPPPVQPVSPAATSDEVSPPLCAAKKILPLTFASL